jgi:hypothetical protein
MVLHQVVSTRMIGSLTPIACTVLVSILVAGLSSPGIASAATEAQSGPMRIYVDLRPGLCPNHLRIASPLQVPMAIMGTMSFEVQRIEPATVRLSREGIDAEVAPAGWAYADVGTPLVGGLCACHKLRGDGIDDLEFHFSIEDIVSILDLEGHSGETLVLTLSGRLMTGEPIEGKDCAMVISGPPDGEEPGIEVWTPALVEDESPRGYFKFAYHTTMTDRVTFSIYDVQGRLVAKLNDMDMAPGLYTAKWDGICGNREAAPAGIYFARVSNSLASDMKRFTVPQ